MTAPARRTLMELVRAATVQQLSPLRKTVPSFLILSIAVPYLYRQWIKLQENYQCGN
jgi:hypothetical protein